MIIYLILQSLLLIHPQDSLILMILCQYLGQMNQKFFGFVYLIVYTKPSSHKLMKK